MIPKTIHYCWFGDNPKSELIKKCIESWKEFAPDFDIVEWNETNFDISKYKYAKQAYEKKNYAFVSDVARFDVLNTYGGIYLDTDVELIKPIERLLNNNLFMGYDQKGLIATGLIMGSEPKKEMLEEILEYYSKKSFLLQNGLPDNTTVVTIVSDILKGNGFILNGDYYEDPSTLTLYPSELFDPFDYENDRMKITDSTISIHHYAASWKSENDKRIYRIGKLIKKIVGNHAYDKIARIKHKIIG
jgi:hypothetical protein